MNDERAIIIDQAASSEDMDEARRLFREYETALDLDLCFQGFEEELASLPGKYAPPNGRLLIARVDGEVAGSIALRPLAGDGVCEMKRLFVRGGSRGLGLGNLLIERLVDEARGAGYARMRLDTFPQKMAKAVELYRSHGFCEIDPYYDAPHAETLFMELDLGRRA